MNAQYLKNMIDIRVHFPVAEVQEYAAKLGIDQECEPHLLYLAREGILQELPSEWRPW